MNDHKWKNRNNEKHGRVAEPVKGLGRFSTIHDVNLTLVSIVQSFVNVKWLCQGPRSKILSGGGSSVSPFFFGGGGGGEAEACYPGKIRVLVNLRYRKVDLILTKSVLKRNVFTT